MASTTAQVSLTNAATGTGTTIDFTTAKRNVSAAVIVSGTVAAGALVMIEASQDNSNWVPLAAVGLEQGRNKGVDFAGRAYRYWRARVAADVTGGGRVAVTFMEAD